MAKKKFKRNRGIASKMSSPKIPTIFHRIRTHCDRERQARELKKSLHETQERKTARGIIHERCPGPSIRWFITSRQQTVPDSLTIVGVQNKCSWRTRKV